MLLPITFPHSALPNTLYHYTDQSGLLGILTGRELWATDILYLNDSSEFQYGKDLVERRLQEKKSADPLNTTFYDDLLTATDFSSVFHFFVVSLSEEKDLLSQWYGYTPAGGGFSIGFNAPALAENLRFFLNVVFVKCIYDEAEQIDRIDTAIDDILRFRPQGGGDASYLFNSKSQLVSICLLLKHPAFAAEDEWRLVLSLPTDTGTKFRPGRSMITPYHPLKFMKSEDDEREVSVNPDNKVPVAEIVVGPTPHPELSKQSVERFLSSQGIGAQVSSSTIPFRAW